VTSVADSSGTTEVRAAHRFDEDALARWMSANVAGFRGPLEIAQFRGGQSNPTYRLATPAARYVLRRKPPGALLPGAHAVEREYRVLAALGAARFPVPRVYGLCTDREVIGTEFFIMDCVEGRVVWDATFPDVPRAERSLYFDAMNETLARLHGLDYRALGLEGFGRTGDYLARQIARWSKQYLADAEAGRVAALDRLVEWLPLHIPAGDETALVHGDFRCDNLIFHPREPRVLAVLDWELSTLGHPLADLAYHAMMYRVPPVMTAGLLGADLDALGIPCEAEYLAAYCRRTGRDTIPGYEFFACYNLFRFAAILHGIRGRAVRGTAASSHAREMAANVELFAELAWQGAERIMRS
jgi:aminoglycoside phosphotransferase (APT) family kinase protein